MPASTEPQQPLPQPQPTPQPAPQPSPTPTPAPTPPPNPEPPAAPAGKTFLVGYKVVDTTYTLPNKTNKNLTFAVWYPTTDQPLAYTYNKTSRLTVSGLVAQNGKVNGSFKYPLLVFSHGGFACATQSTYIMQYLASKGYIVAAPDHEDAALCSIKGGTKNMPSNFENQAAVVMFPNRQEDMEAVINLVLSWARDARSNFYQKVDTSNIAVFGHSAGGATALSLCGAQETGAAKNYKDSRVNACLLFSPDVVYVPAANFKNIQLPSMYIWGDKDQTHLADKNAPRRPAYDNSGAPKFLVMPSGATHFAFADSPTCLTARTAQKCVSSAIPSVIVNYSRNFLDYYLKKDSASGENLKQKQGSLYNYEYQF